MLAPRGAARLAELEQHLRDGASLDDARRNLRDQGVPAEETAALLTQAELRAKARAKFGEAAAHLLFTPAGLEQATRSVVAEAHAQRFAAAGCRVVGDLGCGIGAESLALQAAGIDARPVEINPFTAAVAERNLGVPVWAGDAERFPLDELDGVFLDPARRTAGHRDTRRITRPGDYSPGLDFAFGLAERLPTGVKLGPGFDRGLIPDDAEAQWVSVDGQLVETGLWFGRLARPGVRRSALVLRPREEETGTHELNAAADAPDVDVRDLGDYLYEPDGAVIRARLIGELADRIGAGMLGEGIAYLTADTPHRTPFAAGFRILERLPAGEKPLRRALAARGIGRLEIKKRGVPIDPAELRRRLRLSGPNGGTLILTRARGRHVALLAERLSG
ncbi:SAM-dependent methyltransferase [Leucobacter weissii]|uniref:SAM-dependent methyltransferase n=1 Tax=Leucobacter weissii TaxID=1983706 RepID=A0A939MJP2_9MICO|nr:SAM-dependent methyltransferase [Leucobacter weissii]MBO1902204.1 SAM-dependent methyltransferase [Leucobacter weissii]